MWFCSQRAEFSVSLTSVHKGHHPKPDMKGLNFLARSRCGHTIYAFSKVRVLDVPTTSPRLGRQRRSRHGVRRPEPHPVTGHPGLRRPHRPTNVLRGSEAQSGKRWAEGPTQAAPAAAAPPLPGRFGIPRSGAATGRYLPT